MKFFMRWIGEKSTGLRKRMKQQQQQRKQQIHQCQIYTYSFFFNFFSLCSRLFPGNTLLSQNSSIRNQSSFSSLTFAKTKPPKPIWSSSWHISSYKGIVIGIGCDGGDDDIHIVVKKDVIRCNTVLSRANKHKRKQRKRRWNDSFWFAR